MKVSWKLGTAAVIVGIAAGGLAAVVIPTAESTPSDPPLAPLTGPMTTKPGLDRMPGQVALKPRHGSVREELRRKDPAGGPDWVLRSMTADLLADRRYRRAGQPTKVGSGICVQLLRDVRGKLGWIDGDNVFRPVSVRASGPLVKCSTTERDGRRRRTHEYGAETLLAEPSSSDASIRGQVVWGFVGPDARQLRLRAGGEVRAPRRTPQTGAFVEFYGPRRPVGDVSIRLRYADGEVVDTRRGRATRSTSAGGGRQPSSRVIARAPDPAGGPSWGLTGNRSKLGRWCVGDPGHLLGDVVGWINPTLGTMLGATGDFHRPCTDEEQPTPEVPVIARTSYRGLVEEPTLAPSAGQLRLQRGRSLIYGRTLDDVVSLTITTPRDIRTVIPSEPGKGFLVVYDGTLTGGAARATAHFRDGRTQVVELPGSGF